MTTVKRTRLRVRLYIIAPAGGGLALSAFGPAGGIAQAGPLRPAITGARVINGTRAEATIRTGITATTGKVRNSRTKVARRAGDPRRRGRRGSHLHRRGRLRLT